MGFKCDLLAISPNIPRLDLLKYAESGADAAGNILDTLLPGWRLTGRTMPHLMLSSGIRGSIYIGSWGPTIILGWDGGDGGALNALAVEVRRLRQSSGPGARRLSSSTVVNSVELDIKAPGWERCVLIG